MPVTVRVDLEQLLSAASYRATRRLAARLAEQGRSVEEWRVLSLLVADDGRSMSDIAASSQLPAPTLTKLIDRMVAGNLVYRRSDERDRRRVIVHLAPRGRTTYEQLVPLVHADQAARDAAISTVVDPALLTKLLSDVLTRLD